MTLLNPLWIATALLAIVVIVLHARKRRHVEVPSLILWRLLQGGAPHRRLTRPPVSLLLFLQLLTVLLAALALAQPLFGARPVPVHSIFVLDASASMQATDMAPSRFAAAVAALRNEVAATPDDGSRVSVIVAGPQPAVLVARQTGPTGILPILELATVTDAGADWAAAAALVPAVLRDGEEARIVVLTDGADTGAEALAAAGPPVDRLVFGTAAKNLGLTASVTPGAAEGSWRVEGTIVGGGADFTGTTLTVRVLPAGGSAFLDWNEVAVAAADFAVDLDLGRPGAVTIALPDDTLASDNAVRFALDGADRTPQVLVVGAGDPPLVRAFQALGAEVFEAAALPADETGFDLVVVDGVTVDRHPATNVLWIGAGRVRGEAPPRPFEVAYASDWQGDHPLSADIDWAALELSQAYVAAPLAGAEVVLEAGTTPLLEARMTAAGAEARLAFTPADSNWPGQAGLPLFVRNLMDWLGTGTAAAAACTTGEPCTIEARYRAASVTRLDGTAAVPFGTLPAAGDFVPTAAGLFRLGAAEGGLLLAVNAAAGESALAPVLEATIAPAAGPAFQQDAWWWLGLAVLLVLLAEAWRAGRGEEGFLRRAGLSPRNPVAGRRRLILALRVAAVAFVVAAVAGLPLPGRQQREDMVLVAGGNAEQADAAIARLAASLDSAGGGARGGIVAGGLVAADLGPTVAALAATGTEDAAPGGPQLRLAAAMIPADRGGRVVVATEGATDGLAVAAGPLAARGIPVDIVPPAPAPEGEVLVASVTAPDGVRAGDSFPLQAAVFAERDGPATVAVLREGEVLVETPANLRAGTNRIDVTIPEAADGDTLFEATVAADGDTVAENNRAGIVVRALPAPAVAIVTPDLAWGQFMADALAIQNLESEVLSPRDAPVDLAGWLAFDVVVLMNTPAIDLDTTQQEQLEVAVRDNGRSLLLLGGANTFGPGGYYETAFERLSPLSSRTPRDGPQAAMMFVLDRSGSMQAAVGSATRLDIAKEATLAAIDILDAETEVGVIVFDQLPQTIVPLQRAEGVTTLGNAVGTIQAGGGTAMFPALTQAIAAMERSDAAIRHIVVLTDGLSDPADYFPILQRARTGRITISTIAIGQGADAALLRQIANIGGGQFSATGDFAALPSIMSREALLLAGSPVRNQSARPFWLDREADFLAGLPDEPPAVRTYVVTTAKPEADVHLAVTDTDGSTAPLLATWRYGSGRVLAFTSHGAGPGVRDWIADPGFPRIWAQAIRHFVPDAEGAGLHVRVEPDGDAFAVTADYVDDAEAAATGRIVTATLAAADSAPGAPVTLTETAPGRYRGTIPAAGPGTYAVVVAADGLTAAAPAYLAYPARLDFSRDDGGAAAALAAATGGRVLAPDDPLFTGAPEWTAQPGWRLWLVLALALFMLDLVIRYAPRLLGFVRRTVAVAEEPAAAPAFMPRRTSFAAAEREPAETA